MRNNFEQGYENLDAVDNLGNKCRAFVLSRKFILGILGTSIVLLLFLLSSVNLNLSKDLRGGVELQNTTWEEYVADCGRTVILTNQARAKSDFETIYAKNIVNWEGVLQKKILAAINSEVGALHIKMNPSDAKPEVADIQLTIPESLAIENKDLFNQMTQGDVLKFKAIILQMGDAFHYNHFEAINVTSTNRKVDITTIPMMNNSANVKKAPENKKGPENIHINFIPS